MTNFTTDGMTVQLNFTHPKYISLDPLEKDSLHLKVLAHEFFFSPAANNLLAEDYEITKKRVPRQISEEQAVFLEQTE